MPGPSALLRSPGMFPTRLLALALLALLPSCGQRDGASGAAASGATVPVEPGNVVGLSVRGEPRAHGEIAPLVEARGEAPVRVKRTIAVERREADRWVAVPVRDLTLRPDCEHAADVCVTLVHGGGLFPPAWNGTSGAAQCTETTSRAVPAGTYRFRLESCEGEATVPGEPFTITR